MSEDMQCKADLHEEIKKRKTIEQLLAKSENLSYICERNMKSLNAMMLELKGIVAMVRPMAKKNDWYGQEIEIEQSKLISHPIPEEVKQIFRPFKNLE